METAFLLELMNSVAVTVALLSSLFLCCFCVVSLVADRAQFFKAATIFPQSASVTEREVRPRCRHGTLPFYCVNWWYLFTQSKLIVKGVGQKSILLYRISGPLHRNINSGKLTRLEMETL